MYPEGRKNVTWCPGYLAWGGGTVVGGGECQHSLLSQKGLSQIHHLLDWLHSLAVTLQLLMEFQFKKTKGLM